MDEPPLPDPVGSPVWATKLLWQKYTNVLTQVVNRKANIFRIRGYLMVYLHRVEKAVIVILDFAQLQKVETTCKHNKV